MIRIITGVPGAGKTYYAIWEIVNRFFKFDKNYFLYLPKDNAKDLYIFSNVEDLKLPRVINFEAFLNKHSLSVEKFFTVETQESLLKKYKKVVYLLDEAQKYFHKKFFNKDVFFLFQYHRHLGIDFYLITQDITLIAPAITSLIEYEIRAVRRTNRLRNVFRYFYYANGQKIGSKTLPADPKIFSLYTSFKAEETIKDSPKPLVRYSFLVAFFVVVSIFLFYYFLSSFRSTSPIKSKSVSSSSSTSVKSLSFKHVNKHVNRPLKNSKQNHRKVIKTDFLASSALVSFSSTQKNKFFSKYVWIPANSFDSTIVFSRGKPIKVMVLGKIYDPDQVPYPMAKVQGRYFFLVPRSDLPNTFISSPVSNLKSSFLPGQSQSQFYQDYQDQHYQDQVQDHLEHSSATNGTDHFLIAGRSLNEICQGLSSDECHSIIDSYIRYLPEPYIRY